MRSTQLTVSQLTGEPVYNWALSATAVCDVLMTTCIFVPFRAKTTVVRRERGARSGPAAAGATHRSGSPRPFEADRAGGPARGPASCATGADIKPK